MNSVAKVFLVLALPLSVIAAPVTSATIIADVTQAVWKNPFGNYLNYHIVGQCFWWTGLKVTRTDKVDQFIPDAIVDVYTNEKNNPWMYAKRFVDPVMKRIGDELYEATAHIQPDSTNFSVGGGGNMMEKFKEVDIIGDPALMAFYTLFPMPMLTSVAKPYVTYYSSLEDSYFWRNPRLENETHPEDLLPGVRIVGSLLDNWGSVFPRIGYIHQLGDYKAAAVIALRAADITTHSGQTHVYNPLTSGSCGIQCHVWPSHENAFHQVKFQEIYPVSQPVAKKRFGVNDVFSPSSYGQSQFAKGQGNYVWVMWRHYRGCIRGKGQYIGQISWQ